MFTVEKLENTAKPGKGQQKTLLISVVQRQLCYSGFYLLNTATWANTFSSEDRWYVLFCEVIVTCVFYNPYCLNDTGVLPEMGSEDHQICWHLCWRYRSTDGARFIAGGWAQTRAVTQDQTSCCSLFAIRLWCAAEPHECSLHHQPRILRNPHK